MTKAEKHWIFGMIYLLGACVPNPNTLIGIVAMILCAIIGTAYLGASIYFCAKGK